jgi:hypothetical protein
LSFNYQIVKFTERQLRISEKGDRNFAIALAAFDSVAISLIYSKNHLLYFFYIFYKCVTFFSLNDVSAPLGIRVFNFSSSEILILNDLPACVKKQCPIYIKFCIGVYLAISYFIPAYHQYFPK